MKTIKELSEQAFNARQQFEALGMVNVNGKTYDERLELDYRYNLAKSEMFKAMKDLDVAIKSPNHSHKDN